MKKFLQIILIIFFVSQSLFANGLLMPKNETYPKDFLRNTVTRVKVMIHGNVAETRVYQEFLNESYDSTDAVYSFPLPPKARATDFVYWYRDNVYQAVLKVKEQAINPGTGDGGTAAAVNKYIGRNGIKIFLKGIQPGETQKVELSYISLLEYHNNKYTYRFPLNTKQFATYPLENLQIDIDIENNEGIIDAQLLSHELYTSFIDNGTKARVDAKYSKDYMTEDILFYYSTANESISVDFYSTKDDSTDGHFALFCKPASEINVSQLLPNKIIFLLSNSNDMYGNPLEQSVACIKKSLDKLDEGDCFNIVLFNNNLNAWQEAPVIATVENINIAKNFLADIPLSYGSDMQRALELSLNQIMDSNSNNSIIVFNNGPTILDPINIEEKNNYRTGIFPISMGYVKEISKVEMTAALNFGFVTYIEQGDNIFNKMTEVFEKINRPLMQDIAIEYGSAGVNMLSPQKTPSLYAGSYFHSFGRYTNSGESVFSVAGLTNAGMDSYDFKLNFAESTDLNKFVRSLWAKEMIDALEWEIEIYGETDELKSQLIDLSLEYNIRCRYTAYIADYENPVTNIIDAKEVVDLLPKSYLVNNYPNPFNPSTTIRFYLNELSAGKIKLLKIYNALGELVRVINLSHISFGWNSVTFNAKDMYGSELPSGIYFAQLQVGNEVNNTIKMSLLK